MSKKLLPFQKGDKLKNEVRVFAGGADNACAALGARLVDEEIGLAFLGTSGVFSSYEPDIKDYQGKLHFFNHVVPNMQYSMGVTLAAGNSLNWFKKTFANELTFTSLLKDIRNVQVGSEGLLFTPYIVGERTPHFDSTIRGSFIGIDTHYGLKHFSRSVLEGITFNLKNSQKIMEKAKNRHYKRLISIGGKFKPTFLILRLCA
ncbi:MULTISPECIES: FGGY-family carbohydrate kinase [unclassified Enterococcus]|uniref:FGGY-family carbohydrate kinase n=1 Tax=unclassified Enterococcus TaxID=2608891 RepID=UPI001EFF5B8C|nr:MULTISPECIES: FGGY-family carbohydrate kinase [unclassified Enterococcus]